MRFLVTKAMEREIQKMRQLVDWSVAASSQFQHCGAQPLTLLPLAMVPTNAFPLIIGIEFEYHWANSATKSCDRQSARRRLPLAFPLFSDPVV
eukprot:COSAG02_NODE_3070_length_7426_cov_22.244438_6_plen_93_part_00